MDNYRTKTLPYKDYQHLLSQKTQIVRFLVVSLLQTPKNEGRHNHKLQLENPLWVFQI